MIAHWKLALLVFLVACWDDVKAEPITIGFNLASIHNPDPGLNGINPGVSIRTDKGWTADVYLNSYNKPTVMAGWTMNVLSRLDLTVGLASGYTREQAPLRGPFDLALVAAPSVRIFDHWRVVYLPKGDPKGSEVYHLMYEREFP